MEILQSVSTLGVYGLTICPFIALMLFAIVLFHEYGHCIAAYQVGGRADTIILWPLGGLAFCSSPHTPKAQFITAFGGPLVNLLFLLLGYGLLWSHVLLFTSVRASFLFLLFLNINKSILLFNMIPCYPLDGGRMFKALLWPLVGYQNAVKYTVWLALIISGALTLYALVIADLSLLIIAVLIFIQSWRVWQARSPEESDFFVGGSFSGGSYAPEVPRKPTILKKWKAAHEEKVKKEKKQQEQERLLNTDMILDKINRVGLEGLTEEERRHLEETSEYLKRRKD
jgi:Zn-dependent protease